MIPYILMCMFIYKVLKYIALIAIKHWYTYLMYVSN